MKSKMSCTSIMWHINLSKNPNFSVVSSRMAIIRSASIRERHKSSLSMISHRIKCVLDTKENTNPIYEILETGEQLQASNDRDNFSAEM